MRSLRGARNARQRPLAQGSRADPLTHAATKEDHSAMDWRNRSACLDEDPELFFPIGNTGPAILQIEEAKQVCRRCEVREQCLAWALEAGQDHGVWGGLSEDERRALKRRNARQQPATVVGDLHAEPLTRPGDRASRRDREVPRAAGEGVLGGVLQELGE